MNNSMSATQLVDVYNYLVTQAEGAIARAKFVARAAGALPSDMPGAKDLARLVRDRVSKIVRAGEPQIVEDQLYGLFRGANRAWGRCITVRRKAMSALRRELVEAAELGEIERVVKTTLLLERMVNISAADEVVGGLPDVGIDWGEDDGEPVDWNNLPF